MVSEYRRHQQHQQHRKNLTPLISQFSPSLACGANQIGNMCHVSHPLLAPDRPTGRHGEREKGKISIGSQSVVGYGMHLSGGSSMSGRSAVSQACQPISYSVFATRGVFSCVRFSPWILSASPSQSAHLGSPVCIYGPAGAVPLRGCCCFSHAPRSPKVCWTQGTGGGPSS